MNVSICAVMQEIDIPNDGIPSLITAIRHRFGCGDGMKTWISVSDLVQQALLDGIITITEEEWFIRDEDNEVYDEEEWIEYAQEEDAP